MSRDPSRRTLDEWLSDSRAAERTGEYLAAFDIARQGLTQHKRSVWLRYQAVRVLARCGAAKQARELYSSYGLDRRTESDIAALGARIAKDGALAMRATGDTKSASVAAELYERILKRELRRRTKLDPGEPYYPAVNAATMRLLADEPEASARLARVTLDLCEEAVRASGAHSYWTAVTEAEAALLLADTQRAAAALEIAARCGPLDLAARASTRKQLRLVCELLEHDTTVLGPLSVPTVAVYTGLPLSPKGKAGSRAAAQIESVLEQRSVGFGYGSLSGRMDILFAEALLARNAGLHLVIPFNLMEFEALAPAAVGNAWAPRLRSCVAGATTVLEATSGGYLGDDTLFEHAARIAMGLARLKAGGLDTEVGMYAAVDPAKSRSRAGAAGAVRYWSSKGLPVRTVDAGRTSGARTPRRRRTLFPVKKSGSQLAASSGRRSVQPVLFGDIAGFSRLKEEAQLTFVHEILGTCGRVLNRFGEDVLFRSTWGDALLAVFASVAPAAEFSLSLLQELEDLDLNELGLPADLGIRLALHIGPMFEEVDPVTRRRGYFGSSLTQAARMEPITPVGDVYVTEAFAAVVAMEAPEAYSCEYVGTVPLAKGFGSFRMYSLKRAGPGSPD